MSPRPYVGFGSAELVRALFEAAFDKSADRFALLLNEIGFRDNLALVRSEVVSAAQRVFKMDKSPVADTEAAMKVVAVAVESDLLSCDDIVHYLHSLAYSRDVADALKEVNQRVVRLVGSRRA